jgi:hypothetical protein
MRTHHVFLSGLVGGLLLDKEALVILLIGLALGAAGGFAVRELAGAYRWARRRLSGEAPAGPPIGGRVQEYTYDADPRGPSW